ncbi:alkaline phosphatase-like protein [Lepidopterella palustris CBS 459.81]|uniref:Alkaline phosphatase-like protein n=1 Tax=Lepidopterella palustris CBS 459.81 TaxID=1314670 RepID=A0A8E2E178_9PEZI|nr:alkaline phosphatase-like protein [Lepidopterella palustris CBS 459.81]
MPRPNFLVIVADDLGFSDVSALGSDIRTPNIDSLSKDGLHFTDFHTASACSPTRSMRLSGTDNHIAGVGTMIESIAVYKKGKPGYEGYLNDRVAPLPELPRDEGNYTMMSEKWHLELIRERWPCARGFDRSYTLLPGAANHYGWEPQLEGQDNLPRLLAGKHTANTHAGTPVFYVEYDTHIQPSVLGKDFYSSDRFADKILQYLTPGDDIASYRGRYDQGPEHLRQERIPALKRKGLVPKHSVPHDVVAKSSSWTIETYAGMVQRMDTQVGRELPRLMDIKELDNTFALFMSDNGAEGLQNMGRYNSYVWYGPHWASAATAPSWLYKCFTAEGSWVPYLTQAHEGPANSKDSGVAIVAIHDEETVHGWELFDRMVDPGETADLGKVEGGNLRELLTAWDEYMEEVGVIGAAPEYRNLVVESNRSS